MRRTFVLLSLAGAVVLAGLATGIVARLTAPTQAQQPPPPATADRPPPPAKLATAQLPITRVLLFSSGVGYFQREGEVEGNTRIDFQFPGSDVNDLIKSLVFKDLNGGRISTISYDSHDPIEKTLKSFALDLTYNPTFGQIINQARGEKVELTVQSASGAQASTVNGVIVGMQAQMQPAGRDAAVEVEFLNLLTTEGLRNVKLAEVQRLRFLNPLLDAEFRRALEVLATAHDTQKKTVSLGFSGDGRRSIRVGYVVENPIWKTSYRLVLEDEKLALQGWAVVENTTAEDWKDIKMALISGRPISFQMDLYQPLNIPRPTVEPELFASLRPPTYSGALTNPQQAAPEPVQVPGVVGGGLPGMGALGAVGGAGLNLGGLGLQGGNAILNPGFNKYQFMGQGGQYGNLGGQFGQQGGNANMDKLTYEELQQRRQQQHEAREKARQVGSAVAEGNGGLHSVASADEIGDYYQIQIDSKVSLARQKSALLPIVSKPVAGKRVSIFNESVHAKFPLLGLKFKNTTGQPLMQGPIAVYEGDTYAGDTRILDLQPDEERLISYAIDLGTEVKTESKSAPEQLVSVKLVKGVLQATHKLRETKTYLAKNRSPSDRLLVIEHPVRTDWTLAVPKEAKERSRDVYRFEVALVANKPVKFEVIEEMARQDHLALQTTNDTMLRFFLASNVTSQKVKAALQKAVDFKARQTTTKRDLTVLEAQLRAIMEDQGRIRANMDKVPKDSAAYKRYLDKFDQQEPQIEKLQESIKKQQEEEKQQQKEYEDYLAGLTVE